MYRHFLKIEVKIIHDGYLKLIVRPDRIVLDNCPLHIGKARVMLCVVKNYTSVFVSYAKNNARDDCATAEKRHRKAWRRLPFRVLSLTFFYVFLVLLGGSRRQLFLRHLIRLLNNVHCHFDSIAKLHPCLVIDRKIKSYNSEGTCYKQNRDENRRIEQRKTQGYANGFNL